MELTGNRIIKAHRGTLNESLLNSVKTEIHKSMLIPQKMNSRVGKNINDTNRNLMSAQLSHIF
jgi:hypothetical protein